MNIKQLLVSIILSICIIAISACLFCISYFYNNPKIVLKGEETVTINLYEKYNEMGANAYVQNTDLSDKIKITDNINEEIPGTYKVTYHLNNSKAERNVVVKDNIAPTIELNGKNKVYLQINSEYKEEGAKASDNIDGDITDKIVTSGSVDSSKAGKYVITYSVKDKEGNEVSINREIHVQKPTPAPEIVKDPTTYVKISIANQIIEVYKNNELVITSSIVTGTENYSDSDKGTFMIYSKSKNVYLKGVGYLSFVNYWMPYNRGEGLHDATWRQEFGGDIYKTNGSHGCINMPLEVAEKVYNTVNVGTVVEVY